MHHRPKGLIAVMAMSQAYHKPEFIPAEDWEDGGGGGWEKGQSPKFTRPYMYIVSKRLTHRDSPGKRNRSYTV